MLSPLERTFEVVARREDEASARILQTAIGRDDRVGVEAVLAAGRHAPLRLKVDVVRMGERLSADQRSALRGAARTYADAVRHALSSRDAADRQAAAVFVAAVDDFDRYADLVARLPDAPEDDLPTLVAAIESLTDRMFDHLDQRDAAAAAGYSLRNAREFRTRMHAALADAVEKLDRQPVPERILEWALILADAEGAGVARVVNRVPAEFRGWLERTLATSLHPGILRLPLDLLKRAYPFDFVMDLWKTRCDPPYVAHLMRTWPEELTTQQAQNLAALEWVPWLTGEAADLAEVPPGHHVGMARAAVALGLPDERKRATLRYILTHGDGAARDAAAHGFELLDRNDSHEILRESLDHEDAGVQVWATRNLRPQQVPDAFQLLIARLDSNDESVRDAARRELEDVNLRKAAEMLERTPTRVTADFGRLLVKINPDVPHELRRELAHPIRGRRVTAVRLTVALGLANELLPALAAQVEDSDMLVRRTAVEALAHCPSKQALIAINGALADPSTRVREAAAEALRELRRNAAGMLETTG